MTTRLAIFAIAACLALAGGGASAATSPAAAQPNTAPQPGAAALVSASRDHVTVTGDTVRLSDLFTNTGSKAGAAVDAAPAPGAQAIYDVYRLAEIARANGLTWQARSWSEHVVIERASQTIGADQIVATLREAIEKERTAQEGSFEIEMTNRDLSLTVPADRPATVALESLHTDPKSGQFSAVLAAPAGDPHAVRINVAGRIYRLIEVPTLNRRIAPGDIIGRNDINWINLRADQVSRNVITDAARLIGATPTRTAVAGKMLVNGEVRAPRIVTKGTLVTMILQTPHMVLTSKGRALEDGAKGDVVRVMNTQSKTIIEGEVTSSGMVLVTATAFMPTGIPAQQADARSPARR